MKIINLMTICFLIFFSIICNSQPDESECTTGDGVHYFAKVISVQSNNIDVLCDQNDSVIDSDFGSFGANHMFNTPVNGVAFTSNISIDPSIDFSRGYFNFMEVSQDNILNPLPSMQNMILNASILSDKLNNLSLIVNYKDGSDHDFVSIPLDNSLLDFELTITWLNSGCINLEVPCNSLYGQIEIRVKTDAREIVELIDGIFLESTLQVEKDLTTYLKVSSVFWGRLDSQNYTDGISLSYPSQNYSFL